MNADEIIVTTGQALKLANAIIEMTHAAQAAGSPGVQLSALQAAFSALDAAEAELDAAIDGAE